MQPITNQSQWQKYIPGAIVASLLPAACIFGYAMYHVCSSNTDTNHNSAVNATILSSNSSDARLCTITAISIPIIAALGFGICGIYTIAKAIRTTTVPDNPA